MLALQGIRSCGARCPIEHAADQERGDEAGLATCDRKCSQFVPTLQLGSIVSMQFRIDPGAICRRYPKWAVVTTAALKREAFQFWRSPIILWCLPASPVWQSWVAR